MLEDIKDEFCMLINTIICDNFTSLRECSRITNIPITTLSRVKNYKIEDLKVDNIIRMFFIIKNTIKLDVSITISIKN